MGRNQFVVGKGDFDQLVRAYISSNVAKYIDFLKEYEGLLVKSVSIVAYGTMRDPSINMGFFQKLLNKPKPFTPATMYAISKFTLDGDDFVWAYRNIMAEVRHFVPYFGDCHMLSITVNLDRTHRTTSDYQYIRRPLKIEMSFVSNYIQGMHGINFLWEYRDVKDHRVPKSNANANVSFFLEEPAKSFEQFREAA